MSTDTTIQQFREDFVDLKELYANGLLSDWEATFTESIVEQEDQRPLTEKQMEKVREIVDAYDK